MQHILYNQNEMFNYDDAAWRQMLAMHTILEAAGGIVQDIDGNILMILKRGMWEFPKGKREDGESCEQCAMREVQEECGVAGLSIVLPIAQTFHIYREPCDNVQYIKRTQWFAMLCNGSPMPQPQAEEDITQAAWLPPQQAMEYAEKSYPMVKDLLKKLIVQEKFGS
jgi:8-oxo-dGTP pyrophosphatase MutT (NUDIX family)